jgi:hypothetical protein
MAEGTERLALKETGEMERIVKLIHDELLPIQQMFRSYETLSHNECFRFNPKIFNKCTLKIQEVILIARDLAKEE